MNYKVISGFILSAAVIALSFVMSNEAAADTRPDSTVGVPSATPKKVKQKTVRGPAFTSGEYDGVAVVRTDDQWKTLLSSNEFYILREEGTEKPYTGDLLNNKRAGTYHCAACGLALFISKTKYDSETGWPSFYQPIHKKNVVETSDKSLSEERTEIECARCGSHIGHVFDDGPQPTGLRYCMNSAALKFKAGK